MLPCVWLLTLTLVVSLTTDNSSGAREEDLTKRWVRQIEADSRLSADAAWNIANDRCRRTLQMEAQRQVGGFSGLTLASDQQPVAAPLI